MSMDIVNCEDVDKVCEETECVRVTSVDLQALPPAIRHITAPVDQGHPQHLRPGGQPVQIASHTQQLLCTISSHQFLKWSELGTVQVPEVNLNTFKRLITVRHPDSEHLVEHSGYPHASPRSQTWHESPQGCQAPPGQWAICPWQSNNINLTYLHSKDPHLIRLG